MASGLSACGSGSVASPFDVDAGSEAGAGGAPDTDGGLNVGNDAGDPTLGGPCGDDTQCDDALDCTTDHCDQELRRCRHAPDDAPCADEVYCNGVEVCDPRLGCQAGAPVTCADSDTCTIDTCVERTQTCARTPRDADGDGDPVWNCPDGGDCDDTDPSVSSEVAEICGNKKDDNCDGVIDETEGCVKPQYDVCEDALLITQTGYTSLSLKATSLDYPTSCAPQGKKLSDVVLALQVPEGPPRDIDILAQISPVVRGPAVLTPELNVPLISLATAPTCGAPTSVRCSPSVDRTEPLRFDADQENLATLARERPALSRLHLYGLAPGVYPLYVAASGFEDVALNVTYAAASTAPVNETCGTAEPLVPGESKRVSLASALPDVQSACPTSSGDLLYSFNLAEPRDVRIFANPLDANGAPQLSLRTAHCTALSDELTCRSGAPSAVLFARALPAGDYTVSVGALGPSDVDVRLELSAASVAPADQGCTSAPELTRGETLPIVFDDHNDAVNLGCLAGAVDSSHRLTLAQTSDVLLVERISTGDTGAVGLGLPQCAAATRRACGLSESSPVRARAYAVPAGSYRAVAESATGSPVSLTAFTRKAVPATLVPLADDCSAPFEIPATGGRFKGNTSNAHADFSAGCDEPNQPKNGAPDQVLHLALPSKSRVVLDTAGSDFSTLLSVRRGDTCPGSELPFACAAGYLEERSFLDLELESGDYYVLVDGYRRPAPPGSAIRNSGSWTLDVYVTPDSN